MAQDCSGSSPAPLETPPGMDAEFQFLLCESCHQEDGCPKLLPCLHNVCVQCLQETKPVNCCPICKAPHSHMDGASTLDNVLFANLRAKLSTYERIKSSQDVVCDNCKKEGTYWCPECREFLCTLCFESHQRYLKRENHEARAVKDIKAKSIQDFLAEFKNVAVMFCSNTEHKMQNLSIYCRACQRSLCCICAVLDSRHNGQHCHIREEIQRRQQELLSMSMELTEKKASYDQTCVSLREQVQRFVRVKNQMQGLIQRNVEEMVRLVKEKGEQILALVQEQHQQKVQDAEEKLHRQELMAQQMESCKRVVEQMNLYASDQEVIDMYPFIRESLEELKRKQPPVLEAKVQAGSFLGALTQFRVFYERVMKEKEPAPPTTIKIASSQEPGRQLPVKRKSVQVEDVASQNPPKLIKIEPNDSEWKQSAGRADQEQPGTSSVDHREGGGGSIWSGEDTVLISEERSPISISGSSNADNSSFLNGCPEEESSDGIECVDSNPQEDISSESSQDNLWRNTFHPPTQLFSGEGTPVFFDLKVLPGRILHLVATVDEAVFSIMIQPLLTSPRGDVEGCFCEIGLDAFLGFLLSLHQPTLVGYDLWSMDLPILMDSLEAIKKEEVFKAAVFGFIDALPLIQEKIPDLSSYTLKSLDCMYFWGQLDESQVIDCAKAVRDLCTVLDVNPGMDRRPVITYSSLQNYNSLQPLVTKGHLSRSTVRALALHGVCLTVLFSVYQKDPAHGLQRFARYLNSRQIRGGENIHWASRVKAYFEALPSVSLASTSTASNSGMCTCH